MALLRPVPAPRSRRTAPVLVALLLAAVLAGCGAGAAPADGGPPVLRMGWGVPGDEIKYVMIADPARAPGLGSCYRLEWQQLTSSALGAQSLAAGTLDGATVGSLSAANAVQQGVDLVLTGTLFSERAPGFSTTWLVRADSGITAPEQLRGTTVATSGTGNSTNYVQEARLRDAGLEPGADYEVVEVPYPQMQEALASGRITAGPFAQPFYGAAMASGEFRPLFSVTDVAPEFPQLLQAFSRDAVEREPEAVRCFVRDFAAVADYIADPANREAVIANTSEVTKIPAEVLDGYLLGEQDYYRPPGGALDPDALQATWDFLAAEQGTQAPRVADHVDASLAAGGS
jgi:ABC-type nitrate/sulfonate/bicarbonate transport system substrate-binding protein